MSYAQYLEELQHSESAGFDRFDGLDRGDAGSHDVIYTHDLSPEEAAELWAYDAAYRQFEAEFVGPPKPVPVYDDLDIDIPF